MKTSPSTSDCGENPATPMFDLGVAECVLDLASVDEVNVENVLSRRFVKACKLKRLQW